MNNDRFKFRVWSEVEKRYVLTENLVINNDGELVEPHYTFYGDIHFFRPTENLIVEQCTGLNDANSKIIYEGDIVADKNNKFFIEYSDEGACFTVNLIGNSSSIRTLGCSDYWLATKTIVGNIHENSELLEETK